MAEPIIVFNSSTGSDTAASGAGPATAVTGTAAAHTNGGASTTITLTNTPDLSGVLTDGSHVIWLDTPSGRQYSKITGKDDGADTVTTEDSFNIDSGSAVNYAIGGKRATFDHADSRTLLTADIKRRWTVETETNQTLTSELTTASTGSGAGIYTIRGDDADALNTINMTANAQMYFRTSRLENLKLTNSNGTKNTANVRFEISHAHNCIFGDATNKLNTFVTIAGLTAITKCDFTEFASDAVAAGAGATVAFSGCRFYDNDANGVVASSNVGWFFSDCLFYNNNGAGIEFSGLPSQLSAVIHCTFDNNVRGIYGSSTYGLMSVVIHSCIFSNNSTAGLVSSAADGTVGENGGYVDGNVYFNNGTDRVNVPIGPNDIDDVDPQYADADNGDYTVGNPDLVGTGFPFGGVIGVSSNTVSYTSPGSAQPQTTEEGLSAVSYNVINRIKFTL